MQLMRCASKANKTFISFRELEQAVIQSIHVSIWSVWRYSYFPLNP